VITTQLPWLVAANATIATDKEYKVLACTGVRSRLLSNQ
jgi:hypothetical protein